MRPDFFRRTSGLVASIALLALSVLHALPGQAAPLAPDAGPVPPPAAISPAWQMAREVLFGNRPIAPASDEVLSLEAPYRAEDAATVPVALRSRIAQTPERYIKTAWLLIDGNPSALAGTFHFTPQSGRVDLETRVRIEQYTHLRAVVELGDGSLHMASRYVKASGGCSAPAGKDAAAALANLGKLRLSVENAAAGEPRRVQLMVSHPNTSGLAMDQLTRQYPTPHFVRLVSVSYRDTPVFAAEVNFSLSENPHFRFYLRADQAGELKAEVIDTEERRFERRLALGAAGGG